MANPSHRVVAALIERGGKYLIAQRRDEAVLPGLWEFPGGRVEGAESDQVALEREVLERIGVKVVVDKRMTERHHAYDGYDVHLTLFSCHLDADQEPRAARVKDVRWVASKDLDQYEFPPADQGTMDQLLGLRS